jgi:hypothetical protein
MLILTFLTGALSASSAVAAGEGTAQVKPRVAVVDVVDLPERMEETRSKLRELLDAAVRQHGFEVIRPSEAPTCPTKDCLGAFAASTGATDVLTVRGGRSGSRGYHVELSLWHAATGEAHPAVADCNFCTGPQMADAVDKAARPLLDGLPLLTPAPAPAAAPPPAAVPALVAAPIAAASPATVEAHRTRHVVGWSLAALGAATGIVGGVLWSFDGNGTDCGASGCRNAYHSRGEGMGLVAAGIVLVGAGLWLALDPSGDRGVAVTVGPTGPLVAGRF